MQLPLSSTGEKIQSLCLDPTYSLGILGSSAGQIYKVSVDGDTSSGVGGDTSGTGAGGNNNTTGDQSMNSTMNNNNAAAGGGSNNNNNNSGNKGEDETDEVNGQGGGNKRNAVPPCDLVPAFSLGSDSPHGVILNSKFVTLHIKRTTSRAKASLSLLWSGSVTGAVSCWRHSAPAGEVQFPVVGDTPAGPGKDAAVIPGKTTFSERFNQVQNLGVRRSIPRTTQALCFLPRLPDDFFAGKLCECP